VTDQTTFLAMTESSVLTKFFLNEIVVASNVQPLQKWTAVA